MKFLKKMTMTKILNDTLQFRKGGNYFLTEIDLLLPSVKSEFLNRFAKIDERISSTENIDDLASLDGTKKFYQSVATLLDLQAEFIKYTTSHFASLDDAFWDTIINGEKLRTENEFNKATIQNLYKRIDLLTEGWRAERMRSSKNRLIKAA
jgi:hypothetical protein